MAPRVPECGGMRSVFALVACLLTTSACRSSLPNPGEAKLWQSAKSVVREQTFTLFSPYDTAATANYAESVRAEIELVRTLFPADGASRVRIYLAPIEDDRGRELNLWETPSHKSLQGAATEGQFAFVYLPAKIEASSALERAFFMRGGTLRHELAHLYAARAGLSSAPWFNEGLAQEVEFMRQLGRELQPHPFPPNFLLARKWALPGSLALLLSWKYEDGLSETERSQRYVWAQALFRFLIEQRTEDGFEARARAVMQLAPAEIMRCEPAWLAWLLDLDPLARIRAGAHSASPSERVLCMNELPSLAEARAPELFTRAADELALEMLGDPECAGSAADFLLFFRAANLRADDIEPLCQSPEPARVLVGQALRAMRKEPVDLAQARSAWQRVPANARARFAVLESLIPGLHQAPSPAAPLR